MRITGEQLRRFIVSEARAAWAELRAQKKTKALSESKSEKSFGLIVENAAATSRLSDREYDTFQSVLEGCVWLANKGQFKDVNSDLFVSKISENALNQVSKRLDEGVKVLEKLQLDSNVKKTAVKYLKSLVLSPALTASTRVAGNASLRVS